MKRNWKQIKEYEEILFDFFEGIARITINRPRYRNAFTPRTTWEISDALYYCREAKDVRVVVLTGAPSPLQEGQTEEERLKTEAFCARRRLRPRGGRYALHARRWSTRGNGKIFDSNTVLVIGSTNYQLTNYQLPTERKKTWQQQKAE